MSVPRLHARADLADPALEVRRARARARLGDATWRQRIERYERGETLMVGVTASAVIDREGQGSELRCFAHEVLWLERPIDSGELTARLLDVAYRDFPPVGARLRDTGIQLSGGGDSMPVQLVIDPTLAAHLGAPGPPSPKHPAVAPPVGADRPGEDRPAETEA